jgi:hypothetical protein
MSQVTQFTFSEECDTRARQAGKRKDQHRKRKVTLMADVVSLAANPEHEMTVNRRLLAQTDEAAASGEHWKILPTSAVGAVVFGKVADRDPVPVKRGGARRGREPGHPAAGRLSRRGDEAAGGEATHPFGMDLGSSERMRGRNASGTVPWRVSRLAQRG